MKHFLQVILLVFFIGLLPAQEQNVSNDVLYKHFYKHLPVKDSTVRGKENMGSFSSSLFAKNTFQEIQVLKKRHSFSFDILIAILCILLGIFSYKNYTYSNSVKNKIYSFFIPSNTDFEQQENFMERFLYRGMWLFLISVIILFLIYFYKETPAFFDTRFLFLIFLFYVVWRVAKYLINKILSTLFGVQDLLVQTEKIIYFYNKKALLFILPISLLYCVSYNSFFGQIVFCFLLFFLAILTFLKMITAFRMSSNSVFENILHFFIYFCLVEILPVLVLIKNIKENA